MAILSKTAAAATTLTLAALLAVSAATQQGDMTYYSPGLGACGGTNSESDRVVALNTADYGGGSACGREITISYGGRSAGKVTVVDLCPGCTPGGIDVSPVVFQELADQTLGRIQVDWQ